MAVIIDNIAPMTGDPATDIATLHSYVQYLAESINRADDEKKHTAAEKQRAARRSDMNG